MKRLMLALAVLLELSAWAQIEIGINQYLFNPYVLNAAFTGKEQCQNFSLSVRRQWVNLEVTENLATFSIDANLSKGGVDNFKAGWHGVGGQIVEQRSGNFKVTRVMGSYAYHLRVDRDKSVSFGTFVAVKRMMLMRNNLRTKDPNDPVIENSGQTFIFPEISPGIWYSSPQLYGGISVWNVSHRSSKMMGQQIGDEGTTVPHYYLSAGYKYEVDDYLHIIPSTHIRIAEINRPSIDINTNFQMGPYFRAGIGYRWQDALTANANLLIGNKLSIGYGFDYTVSQLRHQAGNSHELFITFTPCTKEIGYDNKFWCPAY